MFLVQDATSEKLEGPDWAKSLAICDLVTAQRASGQEVTLAVKKRLAARDYFVQVRPADRAQVAPDAKERRGQHSRAPGAPAPTMPKG